MLIVLCETTDRSAIWAAQELRRRSNVAVHLVSPQMLFAGAWEHRVGDGPPLTRIRISNKLTIESGEVQGVLNRIAALPGSMFPQSAPGDRVYAIQECSALFLSWLESLRCPVLNRGCAQGLCGAFRPPEHWHALAARVGLPAGGVANESGIVICRRWIGPNVEASEKFVDLARAAGTPILGVELASSPKEWRVTGGHPRPELLSGGAPAIDALVEAFT
jgi:hypothetical protein